MSDLYYHLQGELEGRKMSAGPFKELSQFLIESKVVKIYEKKCSVDPFPTFDDVCVFDLGRIQADLGLDVWDFSEWKASKAIADTMLSCMQEANSMVLIGNSKLSSLKALITVLTVYEDSVSLLCSDYFIVLFECLLCRVTVFLLLVDLRNHDSSRLHE